MLRPAYAHPQHLHSFPTRRSSDLSSPHGGTGMHPTGWQGLYFRKQSGMRGTEPFRSPSLKADMPLLKRSLRSEEHTSELQSRRDFVCRLLLERKKKEAFVRDSKM